MSARIRQALCDQAEAKRAEQAPPAPVNPAPTKPAPPSYRRVLMAKRIGSPGSGVVIDEREFAGIEVLETFEHPSGYRVHKGYGDNAMTVEVIEIPSVQAREILETLL